MTSCADDGGTDRQLSASTPLLWPEPLAWRDHGVLALDGQGQTGLLQVSIPPDAKSVVLRATPAGGAADPKACFRFAELRTSAGAEWVGAAGPGPEGGQCPSCPQPVYAQRGFASLVIPGPGLSLQGVDTIQVRVTMRECVTGVAVAPGQLGIATASLHLESAVRLTEPVPQGVLELAVVRLGAAAQQPDPAAWTALWQRTRQAFAAAGIEVVVRAELNLPAVAGVTSAPLTVGPEHTAAVDALQMAIDAELSSHLDQQLGQPLTAVQQTALLERTLVVVVAPCLRLQDPLQPGATALRGHATRMPGGVRVAGVASLTLLGATDCAIGETASDPELLGNVLAHELGHQLGLFHSDVSPSEVGQGEGVKADLMHSRIAEIGGSPGFTAQQAAALAKHPSVYRR